MKRLRWLFFVGAVLSLITTPSAIYNAIELCRSDHKMIAIALLAFTIRFAVTAWFIKLWWSYRESSTSN